MKDPYRSAIICMAVAPTRGLRKSLLEECLPAESPEIVLNTLVESGLLWEENGKVALSCGQNVLCAEDAGEVCLEFLGNLLRFMARVPDVAQDRDYMSVLHTFRKALCILCGRDSALDEQLAQYAAALAALLKKPYFHFVTEDTCLECKQETATLCAAEEFLLLRVLEWTAHTKDAADTLTHYRFALEGLQAISRIRHAYWGSDAAAVHVDEMMELVAQRVDEWESVLEIETALQELKAGKTPD